jgi:hypothetical protein
MKSKKVSFIVSPGLEMWLKAIPDTVYYRDISEFLTDAVKTLMDERRDLRTAITCTLYEKGKSLGKRDMRLRLKPAKEGGVHE